VDLLVCREDVRQDGVTGLALVAGIHRDLGHEASRRNAGGREMAGYCLRRMTSGTTLDETDLHRLVTVGVDFPALYNHAWPGLDDGDGNDPPILVEDLGHADLLA